MEGSSCHTCNFTCCTVPGEDLFPAAVLDKESCLSILGEGHQGAVGWDGGLRSVFGVGVQLPHLQLTGICGGRDDRLPEDC